ERLVFANAAFCELFGRGHDLAGTAILDLLLPAYRESVRTALQSLDRPPAICFAEALRGNATTIAVELRFEPVVRHGAALLAIFAQDVTDRFRMEAQLNLLAYSDPLTGLPNRAMFADRLRQAALAARRTGSAFAAVMLDLDGFKQINDRHGHEAGD